MNVQLRHYDIIRRQVVTEKSTMASASNAVVFEVDKKATKPLIKDAVEALFSVKVESVNVLNTRGKTVRFRGRKGRRKDVKKAYVRLMSGYSIDVSSL